MKKFIVNIIYLAIPFAVFILAVNIIVDTGFVIKNRSPEIAKILVSGKDAGINHLPSGWASLQTSVVEEQKKRNDAPKDILVFGSSRSSEISSDIFPENTFYNCAVPGANILDYIALYGLYKRNNLLPKYLIINMDIGTFHSEDVSMTLSVNRNLLADYKNGLSYLGLPQDSTIDRINYQDLFEKFTGLFNLNYCQLNLAAAFKKPVIEIDFDPNRDVSYFRIRKDGGYSLTSQSAIDSNAVVAQSKKFIDNYKSNLFHSEDTSSIYFGYFKKLLIGLKKDGVMPIVYISPINPMVFDYYSPSMNVATENYADLFCKQNDIVRVGSFNPHKYGYNRISNFFIDQYHPVKSVVCNIFYYHRDELQTIGITSILQPKQVMP